MRLCCKTLHACTQQPHRSSSQASCQSVAQVAVSACTAFACARVLHVSSGHAAAPVPNAHVLLIGHRPKHEADPLGASHPAQALIRHACEFASSESGGSHSATLTCCQSGVPETCTPRLAWAADMTAQVHCKCASCTAQATQGRLFCSHHSWKASAMRPSLSSAYRALASGSRTVCVHVTSLHDGVQ